MCLDFALYIITIVGFLQKWREKYELSKTMTGTDSINSTKTIDVQSVLDLFRILGYSVVVGFVTVCIEIVFHKYHNHKYVQTKLCYRNRKKVSRSLQSSRK